MASVGRRTAAIESAVNRLAAELGIDPVEMRLRNALVDGDDSITQTVMPEGEHARSHHGVLPAGRTRRGLPTLRALPRASLPSATTSLRKGRGFAAGFKNIGFSFGFPERCG